MVTIGPMMVDNVMGRKSSEVSHRNKKPTIITRASSSGGGNATPALSGGLGSVLCLEFNSISSVYDYRLLLDATICRVFSLFTAIF